MASPDRVRIEIAFDGGQIMSALVTAASADALEQALGAADIRAGTGEAALSLDAEDLTTQTFLKMLEAIGRFRFQSAPFSAWLFRIAHNLAMDHFRAARRWQPEEEVPEQPGEEEPSAEAQALQSIGRQSMLELIEDLSPEQQQVLTLKFVFNFANADVATILDKTEGAVKSLQHRALVSLQKQIAAPE